MASIQEEARKGYAQRGTYNDAALSAADQAAIADLKRQWSEYNKAGDHAGMNKVHDQAEAIRAGYGYSGGGDGSEYLVVDKPAQAAQRTTVSAHTPAVNDYSRYIQQMNAATRKKALAELEAAYKNNVATLDRTRAAVTPQYTQAKNNAAGQSEIAKRQFAEFAAARGLGAGAAGQAELSRGNSLQTSLRSIDQAEADTMADLELQQSQMETEYKSAIAKANASGDYELAAQLYQEMVRQDEIMLEQLQWNAQQELQERQMAFQQQQADLAAQQWQQSFDRGVLEGDRDYGYRQQQADLAAQQWQQSFDRGVLEGDRDYSYRQQQLQEARKQTATDLTQQQYENKLALAKQLAAYGDFSGYRALGIDTTQMKAAWAAQLAREDAKTANTVNKPTLTAAQVLKALENGQANETTLAAYRYYFGEDYVQAPKEVSYETMGTAARDIYNSIKNVNSVPAGRDFGVYFGEKIEKAMADGSMTEAEAAYLLDMLGV